MAFSGVQNGGIKVGTVYSYMQGVMRMYGSVVFGQTNIFVWGGGRGLIVLTLGVGVWVTL